MVTMNCLLLIALSAKYVTATTDIPASATYDDGNGGNWWVDDYQYDALAGLTDNNEDKWYNGGDVTSDLSDVESCTNCNRDDGSSGTKYIHGWYSGNVDGENSASDKINRDFTCNSKATIYWEMTVYFCTNYVGSGNPLDYFIEELGGAPDYTLNNIQITSNTAYNNRDFTYTNPQNIQDCEDTDNFFGYSTGGSFEQEAGAIFTISIGQLPVPDEWSNSNWGNGAKDATAFNNFKIRCEQIVTPDPTAAPTSPTGEPTVDPTGDPTSDPTIDPTSDPSRDPTENPTTPTPTDSPTSDEPTTDPSSYPTTDPTKQPTMDPTEDPTKKPTKDGTDEPTKAPIKAKSIIDNFSDAFGGGGNSECTDGWVKCNEIVFIILLIFGIVFIIYWIVGCVWYFWRQKNRPVPAHMLVGTNGGQAVGQTSVEMNSTGAQAHATSDRWKSAWELEQEQKRAAEAGGGGGGGAPGGQDGNYAADTGAQW